jgi:Concanavalin A-like lectin/glucanases superfamily
MAGRFNCLRSQPTILADCLRTCLLLLLLMATAAHAQTTIAHWSFDTATLATDGSGNITGAADSTGNHNATNTVPSGSGTGSPHTSQVIPGANSIAGKFAQGLTLSGGGATANGGQFLTYPILSELMTAASAPGAPNYSVSYWINTTTTNQHQFTVMSNWGNSAANPGRFTYAFGFNVAGGVPLMRGQSRFNDGTTPANGTDIFARPVPSGTSPLNDGNWHMMTWTFNTTSGQLISYFDGAQVDSFTSGAANFNMVLSSSTIGSFGLKGDDNANPFINGSYSLDEAWVYNGVLTAQQVGGLFSANDINAAPPAVTGDYNNNGVVDAADYVLWRKNVGQPGGTLPNDATGANPIGDAQYNQWRANFGKPPGSGAALGAIPEPATLALTTLAFGALFYARRKRPQPRSCDVILI